MMLVGVIVLHFFAAEPEDIPPVFVEVFQDTVCLSKCISYLRSWIYSDELLLSSLLIVNKSHNLEDSF